MKRAPRAFTLIELLVVTSIIGVLVAITVPVAAKARSSASMSREIGAARQLMLAYTSYAADHDGELLPGYGNFPATDREGVELHDPVNRRYPWRLAPYLEYDMRVLWGNNADDQLAKAAQGPRESYIYAVSVQPALGINATFIGGDYQRLPPNNSRALAMYGEFCITRMVEVERSSQLIVFASAASEYGGGRLSGYFKVEAPYHTGRVWPLEWSAKNSPVDFGYVDFRYSGKAVAAMLDGHVEALTFEQMNDMRHWSKQAAIADMADWTLGKTE